MQTDISARPTPHSEIKQTADLGDIACASRSGTNAALLLHPRRRARRRCARRPKRLRYKIESRFPLYDCTTIAFARRKRFCNAFMAVKLRFHTNFAERALGGRPKIRFSVERLKLQRIGTYERPERSYSIISSMCRFFLREKGKSLLIKTEPARLCGGSDGFDGLAAYEKLPERIPLRQFPFFAFSCDAFSARARP